MEATADCEGALKFRLDAESSQKGIEAGPQCEWLYAAEGQIWLECGIQLLEAKCILHASPLLPSTVRAPCPSSVIGEGPTQE